MHICPKRSSQYSLSLGIIRKKAKGRGALFYPWELSDELCKKKKSQRSSLLADFCTLKEPL